jgi:hypothetical protein
MRQLFGKVKDFDGNWHFVEVFRDKENPIYDWETFCENIGTSNFFENDVLKLTSKENPEVVLYTDIKWYSSLNGFGIKDFDTEQFDSPDHFNTYKIDYLYNEYEVEIIGNSVDDPELLNKFE